jgi:hypothetical protein
MQMKNYCTLEYIKKMTPMILPGEIFKELKIDVGSVRQMRTILAKQHSNSVDR